MDEIVNDEAFIRWRTEQRLSVMGKDPEEMTREELLRAVRYLSEQLRRAYEPLAMETRSRSRALAFLGAQ